MLKQCKKILGALVLASVLLPVTASLAAAQTGIRSYDMGHYQHAKEVLSQENPKFLTQFQTLRKEIKLIDYPEWSKPAVTSEPEEFWSHFM